MTEAERAEVIMKKHLGVVPPWDRPWKLKAFMMILEDLPSVQMFMGLGLRALYDPARIKLITDEIGIQNGHDPEDYGFNAWLLNRCIGERPMSPNEIFLRCLTCQKIRTSTGMARGLCKCGSNRLSNAVGKMDTRRAMGYLASGY
jgi:hypothetical protein